MGRLSETIAFLNADEMPNAMEQKHFYTHIDINDELKKIRREYRKNLKERLPEQQSLFSK